MFMVAALAIVSAAQIGCYVPKSTFADYEVFQCGTNDFDQIATIATTSPTVSGLILQNVEGQTINVASLSEDQVIAWSEEEDATFSREDHKLPSPNAYHYSANGISASFQNGTMDYFYINGAAPFRIGNSPNGPFSGLPMTKEEMVRTFGKPVKWTTVRDKFIR